LAEPILSMSGIDKFFGGVQVLHEVSFDVYPHEVHALLGENGAGKSTLMRLLMGVYQPEAGTYQLNGQEVRFDSPSEAQRNGISMIYQEFGTAPLLSVAENISLGKLPLTHWGFIDWPKVKERAAEMLQLIGSDVPLGGLVGDLSRSQQQEVEIARALFNDPAVLIMDEPSSALSHTEVAHLYALIKLLRDRGVGIVYISHKLEEVYEIADRVTVLRDGFRVATRPVKDVKIDELMEMITGRRIQFRQYEGEAEAQYGPTVLELEHFGLHGKFEDINLRVRQGEIVGIAGLIGAGKTELAKAIFGVRPRDAHLTGTYRLHSKVVASHTLNPHKAMKMGVGLVTEDRQREGLLAEQSLAFNLMVTAFDRLSRRFLLLRTQLSQLVQTLIHELQIRPPEPEKLARFFSGGNQQKAVIGKWLASESKLLLFDEPTCGVDVGARQEIYGVMRSLAKQGASILVLSADVREILEVSDRVLVMRKGRIIAEVGAHEVQEQKLLDLMLDV
jgi:ribose transport system ATP-binding protein